MAGWLHRSRGTRDPSVVGSAGGRRRPAVPAGRRRLVAARCLAPAVALAALPALAGSPTVVAAPLAQTAPFTYGVAETWSEVAPPQDAALVLEPLDVSSSPAADGTQYVLGRSRAVVDADGGEAGWALHVHAPDGAYTGLRPLAATMAAPLRLDVGFDGTVHVLGRLAGRPGAGWGVLRLAPDGAAAGEFPLLVAGTPADVAVAPDGRVYVTMSAVTGGPPEITVYDPDGRLLERIVPPERGADARYAYGLYRLDVDADGTIYVIAVAERPCPPELPPPRTPIPVTPTPRPSMAERPAARADQAPPTPDFPCRKEIVLVFGPDHLFVEEVPNPHTTDIAVGPSGVFVSTRQPFRRPAQRVFPLGAESPAFRFPFPDRLDVPVELSTSLLQLDVTSRGHVLVLTGPGEPFYRGAADLGPPDPDGALRVRASALGVYDRPALAGPQFPRRVDARSELLVLEAPHQRYGPERQANTAVELAQDAAAIQRWTLHGRPFGQWVQHDNVLRDAAAGSDITNSVHPLLDVATDGEHVYAVSAHVVWHRPASGADSLPPDWQRRVSGAYFMAVSADAGRVAVLNATVERVLVLDQSGWPLYDRPIFNTPSRHLLSDLALHGERVYIADEGRQLILVRSIDGRDLGEWPVSDGPRSVAVGRDGDVYVLGRGGGATRHRPDGELVAAWRVPGYHRGVAVDAQDLTVGDDDRVYVSFVGLSDPPPDAPRPGRGRGYDIDAGGIWVFEPRAVEAPPSPPAAAACSAVPGKSSQPKIVLLGEEVEVALTVDGRCPGRQERQQLFIVLDTSWSMHDNFFPGQRGPGALTRARAFLNMLLLQLDPDLVELGLVTFSDGAGIEMPLPSAVPDVRARILSRIADGDTRMGAGIALAHRELTGPRGKPDGPRTVLIVTDGVFKDDPGPAVAAARADGIRVKTVVLTTPEFDAEAARRLAVVMSDPRDILMDPIPDVVSEELARLVAMVPNPGLFQTITIDDVVPGNMHYIDGSAEPPAVFDADRRVLSWTMGPVAADEPIRLRFRLRPLQTGTWPTNVRADAAYVDALGNEGRLAFPVPWVLVLAPDPLATTPPPTATPTPVPTATPARRYTIYLPIAYREPRCVPKTFYSDIALVLDMSTSMDRFTDAGRTKREAALTAARRFVRLLQLEPDAAGGHHQVAVVGFNDFAWTAAPLGNDRPRTEAALAALEAGVQEGTRLDLAFAEGQRALQGSARRADNRPVLVLLTDGLPNRVPTPAPIGGQEDTVLAAALRVKNAGTTVYTIGLGGPGDILSWMLEAAASEPSMYYETPDAEDLAAIYRRILVRITCE